MKRFVIATASALFLIAGTATASVPSGPASRSAHQNPLSTVPVGGAGLETVAPVGLAPLLRGFDPAHPGPPRSRRPGHARRRDATVRSRRPGAGRRWRASSRPRSPACSRRRWPVSSRRSPPAGPVPVPVPGVTPAPKQPSETKVLAAGPQEGVGQPPVAEGPPGRGGRGPVPGPAGQRPRRLRHGQRHPRRRPAGRPAAPGQPRRRLLRRHLLVGPDSRDQERDGPDHRPGPRRRQRLRAGQRPRGRRGHRPERPEPDHPRQRGRGQGPAVDQPGDQGGRPGQRRRRCSAPASCGARPRARPTPPAPPAPTCPTGSATPPTSG